jgi:hypothetical protein
MITRRKLATLFASVAGALGLGAATVRAAAPVPAPHGLLRFPVVGLGAWKRGDVSQPPLMTWEDFQGWLIERPERQHDWTMRLVGSALTNEVALGVKCKDDPEQIAVATDSLLRTFQAFLMGHFAATEGDIYWRVRPEIDTWRGELVEYREDGPDVDPVTDRRCVIDRTTLFIKVYARLAKVEFPIGTRLNCPKDRPLDGWRVVGEIPADNVVICEKV